MTHTSMTKNEMLYKKQAEKQSTMKSSDMQKLAESFYKKEIEKDFMKSIYCENIKQK